MPIKLHTCCAFDVAHLYDAGGIKRPLVRWVLRLAYFIAVVKYTIVLEVKGDFLTSRSKQYKFSFTNIYRHFVGTKPVCYFLNFGVNPFYQDG